MCFETCAYLDDKLIKPVRPQNLGYLLLYCTFQRISSMNQFVNGIKLAGWLAAGWLAKCEYKKRDVAILIWWNKTETTDTNHH